MVVTERGEGERTIHRRRQRPVGQSVAQVAGMESRAPPAETVAQLHRTHPTELEDDCTGLLRGRSRVPGAGSRRWCSHRGNNGEDVCSNGAEQTPEPNPTCWSRRGLPCQPLPQST